MKFHFRIFQPTFQNTVTYVAKFCVTISNDQRHSRSCLNTFGVMWFHGDFPIPSGVRVAATCMSRCARSLRLLVFAIASLQVLLRKCRHIPPPRFEERGSARSRRDAAGARTARGGLPHEPSVRAREGGPATEASAASAKTGAKVVATSLQEREEPK